MESSYRKIFDMTSLVMVMFLLFTALAANAQKTSEADKIKVTGIRVPIYQEGKDIPILILSSEEAKPIGVRFEMKGVKLVWLGDTMKDIKGTVETPVAVYDQSSKTVAGSEKITYRSKDIDIDGIGFDIDQEKKTLHIRSNVEVTLKGDLSSDKELRETKSKPLKGSKLSLVPTTKAGKQKAKESGNDQNLKKLLNEMNVNNQKAKAKEKN